MTARDAPVSGGPEAAVAPPMFACYLDGRPHGQGSMNLYAVNGHAHGDYPATTKTYRNSLVDRIRDRWADRPVCTAPVTVRLDAWLPRPASHWLPANRRRPYPLLRPAAPVHCTTGADLDKICRLAGDALQAAGVVKDDRQICGWDAVRRWSNRYDSPGCLTLAVYPAAAPDLPMRLADTIAELDLIPPGGPR